MRIRNKVIFSVRLNARRSKRRALVSCAKSHSGSLLCDLRSEEQLVWLASLYGSRALVQGTNDLPRPLHNRSLTAVMSVLQLGLYNWKLTSRMENRMKFSKNNQFVIQVQRNGEPYFNSEKLLSTTMFGWFHPSFSASWVVPAFMYRSTYFSVYTVSNFDHNFTLFISFPLLSAMKIVTSSFLSGIIPVKEKRSHL